VFDVEHDLALDQQLVAERQLVLCEVDRALDRVLDRDESEVDLAASTASSTSGIVRYSTCSRVGEVGLRLQRLLGERAERPQEADLR
jgi:hypothetical protein